MPPHPVVAHAGPTKRFFVHMLTRDIDLDAAILDLVDNCVDGILRWIQTQGRRRGATDAQPYKGFWAKIAADTDHFEIRDNCGGIGRQIAIDSAFMLGRPDSRDLDLETVGMYGIGMKRAIFKMGRRATVTSQPAKEKAYKVEIPPEWLETEGLWVLPLVDVDEELPDGPGTRIFIGDLTGPVQHEFDKTRSNFLGKLHDSIAMHFALILGKGFRIDLNDQGIKPLPMTLLAPEPNGRSKRSEPAIRPYVFKGTIDEVSVWIVVGFYRPLATQQELESDREIDDDDQIARPSKRDNAGWTVICNDRIVLHADKSPTTGWGAIGVPKYHNQFISIAGVVSFRSTHSAKLPINTTKRGIDVSSTVFSLTREYMQEGLKTFTSFTNRWKGREEDTARFFRSLVLTDPATIATKTSETEMSAVRKLQDRGGALQLKPDLPKPHTESTSVRIAFSRPRRKVMRLAELLFDDANVKPEIVGEACFDRTLEQEEEK